MEKYGHLDAEQTIQHLLNFIDDSPSAYQACDNEKQLLKNHGFEELSLTERWHLEQGKGYMLSVGDSALIAFRVGAKQRGFRILGAHNDSPGFRLKSQVDRHREGLHVLNVEPYGGAILRTWLDRPLSVAGRVFWQTEDAVIAKNIVVDEDLFIFPSLAIHMGHEVNQEGGISPQNLMQPLFSVEGEQDADFVDWLARYLNIEKESLLSYDLFLYAREKGCLLGQNQEFFSVGRIDNLAMAHAELCALLMAKPTDYTQLVIFNDHEEIGSGTREGANSIFVHQILERLLHHLCDDAESRYVACAESFMISADQAHAVHPSYPEVADPTHRPRLNGGPVLKMAAGRSYNTDGFGEAQFLRWAKKANITTQVFYNHSDRRGGSTIGPLTERWTGIAGIDVGNPMLSMHSVRELAGVEDHRSMMKLLQVFLEEDELFGA